MPALDVILYYNHGLYGDAGMAVYYTLAAVYGLCVWKFKKTRKLKQELPIIHMPKRQYLPAMVFFFVSWGAIYYVLNGRFIIVPIGAISGSCSSCISCIICIKFIFLFIYLYSAFDFYVVSVLLFFLSCAFMPI